VQETREEKANGRAGEKAKAGRAKISARGGLAILTVSVRAGFEPPYVGRLRRTAPLNTGPGSSEVSAGGNRRGRGSNPARFSVIPVAHQQRAEIFALPVCSFDRPASRLRRFAFTLLSSSFSSLVLPVSNSETSVQGDRCARNRRYDLQWLQKELRWNRIRNVPRYFERRLLPNG
jgi:hypothetical protein